MWMKIFSGHFREIKHEKIEYSVYHSRSRHVMKNKVMNYKATL